MFLLKHLSYIIRIAGLRQKDVPGPNLFSLQLLGNILAIHIVDVAAVLLINLQFPVAHFQSGLDLQQIGAKGGNAGAAAAFPHEFQGIQHKAGGNLMLQFLQTPGDLCGTHALFPAFGGLNGQQAHTGGEHAAVNNVYALQLPGRQAGSVVGIRKLELMSR